MTPFAIAQSATGWSNRRLASAIGVDEKTVRGWRSGAPDPRVLAWLERLAAWHCDNPVPMKINRATRK